MRLIAFSLLALVASASGWAAEPAPLDPVDARILDVYYPRELWKHEQMAAVTLRFSISARGVPENIEVTRMRYAVQDELVEEVRLETSMSGLQMPFGAPSFTLVRHLHFDGASGKAVTHTVSIAFLLGTCDQIPHDSGVDYYLTVCRARPRIVMDH